MSKSDSVSRPVSTGLGMAAGLIAGAIFKRTWKLVAGQEKAPDVGDLERGLTEVMIAAALQGAIAGAVKAALNHGYLRHRQTDPDAARSASSRSSSHRSSSHRVRA